MNKVPLAALLTSACLLMGAAPASYDERPAQLETRTESWDYERRVVEIPMRDGVKLHTVVLVPRGAQGAPMLLTRTPYDADSMTSLHPSSRLALALDGYDHPADVVVAGGYIRVVQDVRGKYGSEGTYVMNRPFVGSGLNPTKVDHATDAWDTIDWLVKHVPESNGKVGIIGISYDGFTALAALVNPHPALAVAVPMNPMVDGWKGDDWFHNGAFRLMNASYVWEQVATRDNSNLFWWRSPDLYEEMLRAGSAGEFARSRGLEQIGFWRNLVDHAAYDLWWQAQAMDVILARQPLRVPTMLVHSLWDQEDIYGATAVYRAIEPLDRANDKVFLTLGPWFHGQQIAQGSALGSMKWDQDTAKWWRWHVLAPFLAHYLKGEPMDVAPVTAFQSGSNEWQRLDTWPAGTRQARLFLQPGAALGFDAATGPAQAVEFVSDPAHPVNFVPRPVRNVGYEDDHWTAWLAGDQRNAAARPDVLTFETGELAAKVVLAGAPHVHLTASTSGTDSDWVVKLIDVAPDAVPGDAAMGGFQFAVAMDIFRGRYRESLASPRPLQPGQPLLYEFDLPAVNHVFQPGHRIMVQVQSSWFPLYDRNPQTFVPNIFLAKPADFVKATQKVTVAGPDASYIELPLAAAP
ncbi:MAG: CocE/NonD family hydrolase [Steroidobacteraceae bacterium]